MSESVTIADIDVAAGTVIAYTITVAVTLRMRDGYTVRVILLRIRYTVLLQGPSLK